MINLLLGAPGGGKSYEATVYHILPALEQGRKVITNLPLDIEAFARIDASFRPLIEIREGNSRGLQKAVSEGVRNARMFSHVDDYADDWKHPEQGFGSLFVIDECHFALPDRETARSVEEWYSMHRHFNVDVLLITQSHGKISAAIRDLVQMVYRVRKNIALGSSGSYTRKVQDGVRGEVMNTAVRRYNKKFFGLYRSHTQGQAVQEFGAADVVPIWRHWTFMGAGLCALIIVGMIASGTFRTPVDVIRQTPPSGARQPSTAATPAALPRAVLQSSLPPTSATFALPPPAPVLGVPPAPVAAASKPIADPEPFAEKGIHLTGAMVSAKKSVYMFTVSQNGQIVSTITDYELRAAGYAFVPTGHCSGVIDWHGRRTAVTCDLPSVQVAGTQQAGNQIGPQGAGPQQSAPPPQARAMPVSYVDDTDGATATSAHDGEMIRAIRARHAPNS
jgi:zona occludens toxin